MKNIFTFSILFLSLFLGNKKDVFGSYIQYPVDYGVYQRNGNSFSSTAQITFVGTFANQNNTQFQVEKLDQFGAFRSMALTYRSISSNSDNYTVDYIPHPQSGGEKYYYRFKMTIQTGWYRITIKDGNNSTFSRKFGVGEVFVIAGQSNAQGEGNVNKIGTEKNYDCVVSAKGGIGSYGENDVDHSRIFGGGIYMGTLHSDNKIFPKASKAWFYQELGNKIASGGNPTSSPLDNVVPVAFFNCALSGSSVREWKESMDRVKQIHNNSYSNPLISNWNDPAKKDTTAFGQIHSLNEPYFGLQSILSYCGTLFGVRAVLWHQGEAETKMLLSKLYKGPTVTPRILYTNIAWFNFYPSYSDYYDDYDIGNYKTNLEAIIADTRNILGPNLLWAIGKVSLISESYAGDNSVFDGVTMRVVTGPERHANITNNVDKLTIPNFYLNGNREKVVNMQSSVVQQQIAVVNNQSNNVVWASENSDNLKSDKRASEDGTHFNSAGLADMATEYYSKMSNIFAKNPILAKSIPRITYSPIGSTYRLTHISDDPMSYYVWGSEFNKTLANQGNILTKPSSQTFCCFSYAKDSKGRIFISNLITANAGGSGARIATIEKVLAFPNPIQNNSILNLDVDSFFPDRVTIVITNEKGKVLDQIAEHDIQTGTSHYEIDLSSLSSSEQYDILYVKVIKSNSSTVNRILVTK